MIRTQAQPLTFAMPEPTAQNVSTHAAEHARLFRIVKLDGVVPALAEIYRLLAIDPARPDHRRWLEAVDDLLCRVPRLTRPRAVIRVDAVRELTPRKLVLESGVAFSGPVAQFLSGARLVATFIATIGSALERLGRCWLRRGEVVRGLVADAVASELAEAAARRCQQIVREWALPQGLEATPRYSPGYCGLSLDQQRSVFASLPAQRINVRLTESSLMVPVKSVSGLVGIGPPEAVSPDRYPCAWCDRPDCNQRRAPFIGTGGPGFD
jgi:hypothetical protein